MNDLHLRLLSRRDGRGLGGAGVLRGLGWRARDPAVVDRGIEHLEIAKVLLRIGLTEVGDRPVEGVAVCPGTRQLRWLPVPGTPGERQVSRVGEVGLTAIPALDLSNPTGKK